MALFARTTKNLIIKIDEYFDAIELGLLVFREGIGAYLEGNKESFQRHIDKLDSLEGTADRLQRTIENEMINNSIIPQQRSEVTKLIDELDEIIDSLKKSLNEINIELPFIPAELNKDFISLTVTSCSAAEELIPAARAYFYSTYTVREKLLKVYYFESETDKMALQLKKKIFQEMPSVDLPHKAHLRYIIHHIERVSDLAQKAADLLSGMAIKIIS